MTPTSQGFPLSPQQKRLWNWQGNSGSGIRLSISLSGNLDEERLNTALNSLVARHEILRTTFFTAAGMKIPFQVVSDKPAVRWSVDKQSDLEHLLTLDIPALSSDYATLGKLAGELSLLYAGSGESLEEPLQYADYASWRDQLREGDDAEAAAAKAFWSTRDYSAIPPPVLPFERKPGPQAPFSPASIPVQLPTGDLTSAQLLAAWQILLWRLSGQPEVVIGRVSSGRSRDEFASAPGLFANTLPVTRNFHDAITFADVVGLNEVSEAEAAAWGDYFSADAACPSIGFYVDQAPENNNSAGVIFSVQDVHVPTDKFKLALRSLVTPDSRRAELVFDPLFFSPDTVTRFARRFEVLLGAALASPNATASTLPVMDEAERELVTRSFNQTATEFPTDVCVHHLFEDWAEKTPDAPALRCGEVVLSYAELNRRANQLSHLLIEHGVKPNIAVGLLVERSAEMIVGLLGIIKAGGCYLPLIPDNPKARIAHQLAETKAPVVVTVARLAANLPEFQGAVIRADDNASLASQPDTNPVHQASPTDLVYIIYTSGSTGMPKGVAVRHRNLVNYSHFMRGKLAGAVHFATVSTIAADLGNTAIFPALISGGCLHVIPYETAMAPELFASYIAEHPIDVLKITPSHLTGLLEGSDARSPLPRKYLVLGGEASGWDLLQRIQQKGECQVLNHYGPTEATVGCCTFTPSESDVKTWMPATIPIGKPIANDRVYIVDSVLEPVPVGVAGELCIAGEGLAQGYINQPEHTANRFVPDPFSSGSMYRTGDLARFLPDGNVEFLGRIDQQVKIRGFRVEPAEIVSALKSHPKVKDAVVIPAADASGSRSLVGYVVAPRSVADSDLRTFLQQSLPDYMIPAGFVRLDKLPLTTNGKLDTRALPSLSEAEAGVVREVVAPRNPDEEKLAAIWMEVLKKEPIGVTDNFFELGGHSLMATQIISRVRGVFRIQLPLIAFLEKPTIEAVCAKLGQYPRVETEEEEVARLLQELEGMSDEEAEMLLAAETQNEVLERK